ncbi:SH3 domain-containing protein [Rhizobium puerariae]|uniref:SH3 domain-containing protein n=1 Tax=Rhizobium puerariae TaxID=1585791 RepID=A0ABV6AR03_9HYPH
MKKILMSVAAFCALIAAPSLAEAAVRGFATANVNMRSGPSTGYPAVTVIPVGTPVTIYGCMSSVNWCDVQFFGGRGWVSGNYVEASYRSNRVYVGPQYYRPLGIPMITFDVDNYWGRYYRDRDFYRERDRWRRFTWEPGRNPPPPPPPRWDRDRDRWDRDPPRWDRDRDRDTWRPGDNRPPAPPVWNRDRDRWDRDDRRPPPRVDRDDDRRPPPPRVDRDEDRRPPPPRVDRGEDRRPPPPIADFRNDRRSQPRADQGDDRRPPPPRGQDCIPGTRGCSGD